MGNKLRAILLMGIENFIFNLSFKDQNKIFGAIESLRNRKFDSVYVKQIKGNIKELRVRKYRLLFFIHEEVIYFGRIFIKKTNETPINEISMAEKYYKIIIDKKT